MAKEKIGLEAVLEMASFNKAVGDYNRSLGTMETKTGGAASRINSAFSSIGAGILKVGKIMAGLSLAGVATLGAGLVATSVAGLKFNNTMEQAAARINAFTKDAGLTAQILEDVRKEAALTPFEFDAMASAVGGLLPAAKQADVGIMDLLKDAEILAASNPAEGLEGAAFALREAVSGDFTSIIERFNLPRSMINKLKEEGLPALEIVRQSMKEMGYDMDLVSALANTAEGRWSTLKDTFTNLAGTVTKPIFDALSSGLGDVNSWLTANQPWLEQMAAILAGKVAEALAFVTQKATELFAAFQAGGFTGLATALGIPPEILDGIKATAEAIQGLFDTFSGGMEEGGAGGGFSALFDKLDIGGMLQGLVDKVVPEIPNFLNKIIDGISTFLTDNWPTIQQTLNEWGTKFWDWINETVLPRAGEVLGGILAAVIAWAFSPETQTKLTEIGTSLGQALVTGISKLFEDQAKITEIMLKIAGGLAIGVVGITGALIAIGASLVAGILDGILTSFGVDLQPATISELGGILKQIGTDIATIAKELGKRVVNSIKTGWDNAWGSVTSWSEKLQEIVDDLSDTLLGLTDDILPLLEEGLDLVTEAIKTAISYFNSLAKAVSDFALPDILTPGSPPPMAIALTDVANSALNAAQGVKALDQGMTSAASAASHMLQNLAVGGKGNIMDAISEGLGFGAKLFKGNEALGELERNAAEDSLRAAYAKLFNLIKDGNAGAEQLKGEFLAGIKSVGFFDAQEIEQALGAVNFGGIVDAIRAQVGPLTLELKAQALSLAQQFAGFATSFAGMLQAQIDDFQKAKEQAQQLTATIDKTTQSLADQALKLSNSRTEFGLLDQKLIDQKQSQDQLNTSLAKAIEEYGEGSTEVAAIREKIADLQTQIDSTTLAIDKKKQAITDLVTEIDKNKIALEENEKALADYHKELQRKVFTGLDATGQEEVEGELAMIELLNDFLAGKEEQLELEKELEGFAAGTTYSLIFDRVSAQEELNRLLAEQQKREEEIARAQEAQRQLAFLQQQVGLMQLIASQGLDPAQVLQGITLGLDASVQDLLNATSNVVEAMVSQLNKDLEIHSPSGVMVDIFGKVMAGAARGVEMGQGLLKKAMAQVPVLNGMLAKGQAQGQQMLGRAMGQLIVQPIISQPIMAGAAGGTNVNMGGVHIGAVNNGTDISNLEERVARRVVQGLGGRG